MCFTALRMSTSFQSVYQCCGRMLRVTLAGVMMACLMGGCAVYSPMEIRTVHAGRHIQHGRLFKGLFVNHQRCLTTSVRWCASVERSATLRRALRRLLGMPPRCRLG